MRPLKNSHSKMICCDQIIEPELKLIEEFVFAYWSCPDCAAVHIQDIGEIDLEQVERVRKGTRFSRN